MARSILFILGVEQLLVLFRFTWLFLNVDIKSCSDPLGFLLLSVLL